jgi:hypothetical protein
LTTKLAPILIVLTLLLSTSLPAACGDTNRFDGPAELPRVTVRSSLDDTPARGKAIAVKAGDNLQRAINDAVCGDTIRLQAGAIFAGSFSFPSKPCDDQHWIIVRTDAPEASLPPEGTRITPCYGGVSSLPGRPSFPCPSPQNVLAKIVFNGRGGSGPVLLEQGANHYRFMELEITRDTSGANVNSLLSFRTGGRLADGRIDWNSKGDHVVVDRVWIHGDQKDETTRGVQLGGSTYVAIVDSYFSDLKCIAATGACTDAQAIGGGTGDNPMGPYKIENNFLEAAGECILLGGGGASETPTDVVIRHNHLFKPMLWKSDEPGFMSANSGRPFIVKNLFELKNAQRVLFEGNILENSWGGFSQTGFAILLTPKNPHTCSACRVTDVTIRNNRISHCASGFQIANIPSATKDLAAEGGRYSIHDITIDDIDGVRYKGFGVLFQIISQTPPLRDVAINHVSGFPSRVLFDMGVPVSNPKIANFTFTNNLVSAPERDISSTGGGPANCAYQPDRQGVPQVLQNCFTGTNVTHNVVLDAHLNWPAGNFTPKNASDAGIPESTTPAPRNFRLCRQKSPSSGCKKTSPYLQAATDGKPIGADIDAIEDATAGAQ